MSRGAWVGGVAAQNLAEKLAAIDVALLQRYMDLDKLILKDAYEHLMERKRRERAALKQFQMPVTFTLQTHTVALGLVASTFGANAKISDSTKIIVNRMAELTEWGWLPKGAIT